MTVVQQLYDLSGIDGGIDRHGQSIASIDETLADNQLLLRSRRAVEVARAALSKQEIARKDLDLTVGSYQDKGKQLEEKLYGGTVRNPRELKGMQQELELLREQQKQQEDNLLLALETTEKAEQRLGGLEKTLREVQTAKQREQAQLLEEKAGLQKELTKLEERRHSVSSQVNPNHMRLYDSLRSTRQSQAVAKVERGICQGCRISLPTRAVQQARTSQEPAQCPSCSRILYVS